MSNQVIDFIIVNVLFLLAMLAVYQLPMGLGVHTIITIVEIMAAILLIFDCLMVWKMLK